MQTPAIPQSKKTLTKKNREGDFIVFEAVTEDHRENRPARKSQVTSPSNQRAQSSQTVKPPASPTRKKNLKRNAQIHHRKYDSMKIDQLYTPKSMDIDPYNNMTSYNSINASREGLP